MQTQDKAIRVIDHKTMRKLIGAIAIVMPTAVWLFSKPELSEQGLALTSISISYWTTVDDIFVGCLFAVGFFLAAYNGTGSCKRDPEFWLSKAACVSAILVALFPTENFKDSLEGAPGWIMAISFNHPHWVHYTASILLFVCLFLLLLIFSFRASRKDEFYRSMEYLGYGLGMLLGMPVLFFILYKLLEWPDYLFYVEFLGLGLFSAGWLRAGSYKATPEKDLSEGAVELGTVEVKDPSQRYYDTNIDVEAGATYFFKAQGCWKDLIISCGPDGWGPAWKLVTGKNRFPDKPFFILCGAVGEIEDHNFFIGQSNSWDAPVSMPENNRLYFFANDRPTDPAYENNKTVNPRQGGPLKVTIYRVNQG